ncbi:MAG: hypothetical protein NW226_06680 [Microscillaceae bacterium]|nr:hypothetical protein [Microscillaceae bacterium]
MDFYKHFPVNAEALGSKIDLHFIQKGNWLKDSEVRHKITLECGRWYVTMVYIWVSNPLHFMCVEIDHYDSEKKAHIYAELFKRGIQKDARGTLKTNEDSICFCLN